MGRSNAGHTRHTHSSENRLDFQDLISFGIQLELPHEKKKTKEKNLLEAISISAAVAAAAVGRRDAVNNGPFNTETGSKNSFSDNFGFYVAAKRKLHGTCPHGLLRYGITAGDSGGNAPRRR